MKTCLALAVLAGLMSSSLPGQTWTSQVGITGGLSRQKPAGTGQNDAIDRWEFPNSGELQSALFVILPLTQRTALETNLAASHSKFTEASGLVPTSTASDVRLVVRADFAVTANAYVAAGALLRRHAIDGAHSTQSGLVGAIGYRRAIGTDLELRIEAQWLTQRKTDSILPSNVYSLLLGVSRRFSPETHATGPAGAFAPWRLQLGAAGGYARTHFFGGFSGFYLDVHETVIDLPGSSATSPPPMFLDAPLPWAGGRLAVEMGFAAERLQQHDTTLFNLHLAPRLNVAIYRGLYAGAGANVLYVDQTGAKAFAFAGANVAAGYRFTIVPPLEERIDISYTAFKQRADVPFAQNSVAILLGLSIPLR